MAIKSTFFLASSPKPNPEEAKEKAEFYRVMGTHIAPLYTLLSGAECPSFELVEHSEDYSTVIQRFPPEFSSVLPHVNEDKFKEALKDWMAHEDAPYDNEKDLRDLFQSLMALSKKADATQQLYLQIEM